MNLSTQFPVMVRVGPVGSLARVVVTGPLVATRALLNGARGVHRIARQTPALLIAIVMAALHGCEECPAGEVRSAECGVRSNIAVRMAALSQVESGDNDFAIGAAGEVSRYQIMPGNWKLGTNDFHFFDFSSGQFVSASPTNGIHAWYVERRIARFRQNEFLKSHGREPSDFEWYLLWSCPARVNNPTKFKAGVAHRFENLCRALSEKEAKR